MPDLASGNAAIGQSGGPTAVINQSLAGVIEALRAGLAASGKVKRILGLRHGVRGLVKSGGDGLADLTAIDTAKLEAIAATPAAASRRNSRRVLTRVVMRSPLDRRRLGCQLRNHDRLAPKLFYVRRPDPRRHYSQSRCAGPQRSRYISSKRTL